MTLLQNNSASAISIQSTGSINYARALSDASILRAYGDNRVAEEMGDASIPSRQPMERRKDTIIKLGELYSKKL
jgi:hypothetical protein